MYKDKTLKDKQKCKNSKVPQSLCNFKEDHGPDTKERPHNLISPLLDIMIQKNS